MLGIERKKEDITVKQMVSAEPEMCLLSMATKKTSLTREDGLLGSSAR